MSEAAWRRRFRAPRIGPPRWARDEADRAFYVSNASGSWQLYAWDVIADTHRRATDAPIGAYRGAIDPYGEFLYWFDDSTGSEVGRWMRQPFHGGGWVPAIPALPESWTEGLLVATRFLVQGSSSRDGFTVHVARDGAEPVEVYRNDQPASLATLAPDETMFALSHAERGDMMHPDVRVLSVDGETIADASDGEGLGLDAGPWSPVPGDARLLLQHERADFTRPEIWSPLRGERVPVEASLDGDVVASWYPDARSLLLVQEHRGRSALWRYEIATGAVERVETPPGTITRAAVRPDGEVWYSWQSSERPTEVRTPERVVLRTSENIPAGAPFTSHDVAGVHCFLVEPPEHARPHPTMFVVHGGPASHDADTFDPEVQAWVDHGYAVALVNYRGSTGYGRAWRDELIGDPGFPELGDVAMVRAWLVEQGIADPERIGISGGSWGGYLTLLGLGTQPELWALGIAAVPVADYVAAYEDEMEELQALDRQLFGGSPAEVPDLYAERSPITYADRVRAPVLVLAGANDTRCPIRQIDNYLERLRAIGVPHEVYRYEAGHGSLVTEERLRQVEAALAFASRHLGTTPPL